MECIKIKKNNSLVRIFNALDEILKVDVYINDKMYFEDIDFMKFSKYINLEKGKYKIDIYNSDNKDEKIISQSIDVLKEEIYTIAITGIIDDLNLLIIPDYISEKISDSYSTFRVINLSSYLKSIDVRVDNEELFQDISFREGTDYVDVYPKQYKMEILSNELEEVVLILSIDLKINRIYTLYIVDDIENLKMVQSVDGNTIVCK